MSSEQLSHGDPADDAPAVRCVTSRELASGWMIGLSSALIGGLLAWGLLQTLHPVVAVPAPEYGPFDEPTEEQAAKFVEGAGRAGRANTVLVLAWTGALLAGAMAVGEGCARRSAKLALAGSAGCALAGAFFGGLAGWLGHRVSEHVSLLDLQGVLVVQVTMLALLGAGVGLAVGSLTRSARNAFNSLIGGTLAGAFAGMVYPVAAAYLMPGFHTEHIIPRQGAGALLWLGIVAGLLGAILPEMKIRRKEKTKPPADGESEQQHPGTSG